MNKEKNKNIYLLYTLGMTIPTILINIYVILMYSNNSDVGMGGLEVFLFELISILILYYTFSSFTKRIFLPNMNGEVKKVDNSIKWFVVIVIFVIGGWFYSYTLMALSGMMYSFLNKMNKNDYSQEYINNKEYFLNWLYVFLFIAIVTYTVSHACFGDIEYNSSICKFIPEK